MKLVEEEVSRVLNLFFQLIFHVVRCYSNTVQDLFNGQEHLYHYCESSTALTPAILLQLFFLDTCTVWMMQGLRFVAAYTIVSHSGEVG